MKSMKKLVCSVSVAMSLLSLQAQENGRVAASASDATHKIIRLETPKVTASGRPRWPEALFDVDPNNRWTSRASMKLGMWLQIEFAKTIPLHSLVLDSGKWGGDYIRAYELFVSTDGKNWGAPVASGKGKIRTEITGLNVEAKFVKIVVAEAVGNHWSLAEIAVNGLLFSHVDKANILPFPKTPGPVDSVETCAAWVDLMVKAAGFGKEWSPVFAERMWKSFPLMTDWLFQDNKQHRGWGKAAGIDARGDFAEYLKKGRGLELEQQLVKTVAAELKEQVSLPATRRELLTLYTQLCLKRRLNRLKPMMAKTNKVIYTVHQGLGGIYSGTSGSKPNGDHSHLRLIDLSPVKNGQPLKDSILFNGKGGMIRDPEVSFDGKKVLFAWKKRTGHRQYTEFKIHELDIESGKVRQLTHDDTYGADFEPCYLPNGDIAFSSDRCVVGVTCGGGPVPNIYVMDKDGKYARQLGFDQTQTMFNHLLDDGRIIYTRRDYNDRGQSFGHALFVMNPDGTRQTEYYGNNSMLPTSIQHTRQIPGTKKTMGIGGGYHTSQGGKLLKIDPSKGTQNYDGLEFFNGFDPRVYSDKIGIKPGNQENYIRVGAQASYPYPISENYFLASYNPIGGYILSQNGHGNKYHSNKHRYALYFFNWETGARELLASDSVMSCMNASPLMARKVPQVRSSSVDYTKKTGTCYVQNVYYGPSSKGIEKGAIKKLRIAKILYKPDEIGGAIMKPSWAEVGPGRKYSSYGWHSKTPVGVGSATFDAKEIVGEVDVHPDGSAMFEVPAREPIYIMMLNEKGEAVQTMRSWMTLMPNETFSCVGCHEENNSPPLAGGHKTLAMKQAPQKIQKNYAFDGKPFSYPEFIQPIWDKHCVSCHAPGEKGEKIDLTSTIVHDDPKYQDGNATMRKFYKSYLTLLDVKKIRWGDRRQLGDGRPNKWVDYFTRLATVELTPPYYAGSTKSGLLKMLRKGHKKVKLSDKEYAAIAAWMDLNVPFIGEYDDMNLWNKKNQKRYDDKMAARKKMKEIEKKNIEAFIADGQP